MPTFLLVENFALASLQYRQDLLRHTQNLLFLKPPSHKLKAYRHFIDGSGIVYIHLSAYISKLPW